jgi:hypothetical protein
MPNGEPTASGYAPWQDFAIIKATEFESVGARTVDFTAAKTVQARTEGGPGRRCRGWATGGIRPNQSNTV